MGTADRPHRRCRNMKTRFLDGSLSSRKSADSKSSGAQGNGSSKGDTQGSEGKGNAHDKKGAGQKHKVKPEAENVSSKPRAAGIKPMCADDADGISDVKRKGDTGVDTKTKDAEEEKRRRRAEKFGTDSKDSKAATTDNKAAIGAQGNGSIEDKGSKNKSPKSPRKSPKLAPADKGVGGAAGAAGKGEEAGKDNGEPEKKKLKLRIGQRDDLGGAK